MTRVLVGGVFSGVSIKSLGTGLTVQNACTGLMNFSVNSQTNLVAIPGMLSVNSIRMNPVIIGLNAGENATGQNLVLIGENAGRNAQNSGNVCIGVDALGIGAPDDFAGSNICIGYRAGLNVSSGGNVIIGEISGDNATNISGTVLVGNGVCSFMTTGTQNTMVGTTSGRLLTTGSNNTCFGNRSGDSLTTGSSNVFIGEFAGTGVNTTSNNIAIGANGINTGGSIVLGAAGTHTTCFVAGIRGATTGNADAIPVLVDSNGQLGTVSSSERYKCDIVPLKQEDAVKLLKLNPVSFKYKKNVENGNTKDQYGLIAEQVHEHMPEMVIYNADDKPETVSYHQLHAHYIKLLQKHEARIAELEKFIILKN